MEALELQRIQFSGHPAKRHDIVLSSDEVVVGRSPQCTCVIADVHISRRHVRFAREDGRWTVTDLSTNGILLNGAPLPRGEPTPLAVSDRLRLDPPGKFLYRVSEPADRPPPTKRALASEEQLKRMEEEKRELEAKLKEENEQLEERLRQVQEQLRGQQEQAEREREEAERAAKEREEYAKKMAALKEEMEKKEQEMEEEKRAREERLRRQLQEQEAALKEQLAAEVARLQQERDNIENQLKGELAATNMERQQCTEAMQARCAAIETQLNALDAKRQLLETQLAATEREKEAAQGEQLTARQSVLDGFGQLMDSELTCSVCSELFFTAVTLNCTHTFCCSCIREWMRMQTTCPICREKVTSETRSLVLDNFIDGMVARLGGEVAEHRATIRREREAAAAAAAAAAPAVAAVRGGRGRGRQSQQRQRQQQRYQQLQQQHQQQQQQQRQQQQQQQQQQRHQQQQQQRQQQHRPGSRYGVPNGGVVIRPLGGAPAVRGPAPAAAARGRGLPVAAGRPRGDASRLDTIRTAITAALAAGANPNHPIVIDDTAYLLHMP